MKKVLAALALVATIGLFGIQQADAQRGPMGWGGGPAGAYCWKATGGQNVQVMDEDTKKAYNAFMDATVDLRREMFSKQEQMRALTFAATPDEAKIDALAKEIFDLRTQIQTKSDELGWQGGYGMGGGRGYGCGGRGPGYGMGYGMGYGRGGCGPCPKWN